ncbi:unnamed protein product [Amoebophrya sp. A25]|nr:unnamed protein product [Amoebophrya sp. A25]|eukprot:GSA25T00017543001.1
MHIRMASLPQGSPAQQHSPLFELFVGDSSDEPDDGEVPSLKPRMKDTNVGASKEQEPVVGGDKHDVDATSARLAANQAATSNPRLESAESCIDGLKASRAGKNHEADEKSQRRRPEPSQRQQYGNATFSRPRRPSDGQGSGQCIVELPRSHAVRNCDNGGLDIFRHSPAGADEAKSPPRVLLRVDRNDLASELQSHYPAGSQESHVLSSETGPHTTNTKRHAPSEARNSKRQPTATLSSPVTKRFRSNQDETPLNVHENAEQNVLSHSKGANNVGWNVEGEKTPVATPQRLKRNRLGSAAQSPEASQKPTKVQILADLERPTTAPLQPQLEAGSSKTAIIACDDCAEASTVIFPSIRDQLLQHMKRRCPVEGYTESMLVVETRDHDCLQGFKISDYLENLLRDQKSLVLSQIPATEDDAEGGIVRRYLRYVGRVAEAKLRMRREAKTGVVSATARMTQQLNIWKQSRPSSQVLFYRLSPKIVEQDAIPLVWSDPSWTRASHRGGLWQRNLEDFQKAHEASMSRGESQFAYQWRLRVLRIRLGTGSGFKLDLVPDRHSVDADDIIIEKNKESGHDVVRIKNRSTLPVFEIEFSAEATNVCSEQIRRDWDYWDLVYVPHQAVEKFELSRGSPGVCRFSASVDFLRHVERFARDSKESRTCMEQDHYWDPAYRMRLSTNQIQIDQDTADLARKSPAIDADIFVVDRLQQERGQSSVPEELRRGDWKPGVIPFFTNPQEQAKKARLLREELERARKKKEEFSSLQVRGIVKNGVFTRNPFRLNAEKGYGGLQSRAHGEPLGGSFVALVKSVGFRKQFSKSGKPWQQIELKHGHHECVLIVIGQELCSRIDSNKPDSLRDSLVVIDGAKVSRGNMANGSAATSTKARSSAKKNPTAGTTGVAVSSSAGFVQLSLETTPAGIGGSLEFLLPDTMYTKANKVPSSRKHQQGGGATPRHGGSHEDGTVKTLDARVRDLRAAGYLIPPLNPRLALHAHYGAEAEGADLQGLDNIRDANDLEMARRATLKDHLEIERQEEDIQRLNPNLTQRRLELFEADRQRSQNAEGPTFSSNRERNTRRHVERWCRELLRMFPTPADHQRHFEGTRDAVSWIPPADTSKNAEPFAVVVHPGTETATSTRDAALTFTARTTGRRAQLSRQASTVSDNDRRRILPQSQLPALDIGDDGVIDLASAESCVDSVECNGDRGVP